MSLDDGSKVHEIASFGTTKNCQDFVHRELLCCKEHESGTGHRREQPRVNTEVDFRHIGTVGDRQSYETRSHELPLDLQTLSHQCPLGYRDDSFDTRGVDGEEVDIAGTSVDLTVNDKRSATGERKIVALDPTND
jgi:hypothetical protein